MNGDFKFGDRVKVEYVGDKCFEFDEKQICEAGFLKKDPKSKWIVIKGRGTDDEYAFPRELFRLVEVIVK